MTDDLVKRVRAGVERLAGTPMQLSLEHWGPIACDLLEAADRIAALEAALRWIKEMPLPAPPLDDPAHSMRTIAARALKEKTK